MSEKSYEQKYNNLMANLDEMHKRNVRKTSAALKSLLIIPTIFLILVFLTNSSKTVFLVLWIVSMFAIAAILIVTEYQDYTIRKMVQSAIEPDEPEEELPTEENFEENAVQTDEIEDAEAAVAVAESVGEDTAVAVSEIEDAACEVEEKVAADVESEPSPISDESPVEAAVEEEVTVGADI